MKLLDHYRKLLFFTFNRYKGNNYSLMREYFAHILISEVEEFKLLWKRKVLDVGGAKGEFCKVIYELRGCDAVNLDPDPGESVWPRTKIGLAQKIPFKDNQFDLVICRGVLEHIPSQEQQRSLNEMYRVTRKDGLCYLMIPPWYNLHAGHGFRPFHILPFKLAKFLRQLIFREKIKETSYNEAGLYPITFRKMLKIIKESGFRIVATKDTHFRLHFLTKVPLLREIAIPAVLFILKK